MINIDKRKYITEVDILDKNSRIDIILEALELIMDKNIEIKKAIDMLSFKWRIEE